MLGNTLTITIATIAYTLARVNQDNFSSVYRFSDATQTMTLQIRHTEEPINGVKQPDPIVRHNMYFEHEVYATPVAARKYYSIAHTLRRVKTSDPASLSSDDTGFAALETSLRSQLIAGEP